MKMAHIEGKNPVLEAFRGNRKINKVYLKKGSQGEKINSILKKAENNGIPIEYLSKNKLEKLALSSVPQGVIAEGEALDLYEPEDILNKAEALNEIPFIILLDHIKDPHNFGAIIRTAYAAGAHGVIYPKDRAARITPVVVKASAGAVEHIMLSKVSNINYTIEKLKQNKVWVAGAGVEADRLYYDMNFNKPLAVVIGSEGEGLKRLVRENCDFLVKIPMIGELGSLNASVAAGIMLFEVTRQRQQNN